MTKNALSTLLSTFALSLIACGDGGTKTIIETRCVDTDGYEVDCPEHDNGNEETPVVDAGTPAPDAAAPTGDAAVPGNDAGNDASNVTGNDAAVAPTADAGPDAATPQLATFEIVSITVDALDALGNVAQDVRSFGITFSSRPKDIVVSVWDNGTGELIDSESIAFSTTSLYVSPGNWTKKLKPSTVYRYSVTANAATAVTGNASDAEYGTFTTTNFTVVPPAPALPSTPMVINGTKVLLSGRYLDGATCAELRGDVTGVTWTSGPRATLNAQGYYEFSLASVYGTFRFTYVAVDCTTGAMLANKGKDGGWANYGTKSVLIDLTSQELAPIQCDQLSCNAPGSCNLRATFSGSSVVSAGTMSSATDC